MYRKYKKLDLKQFDSFKNDQNIAYVLGVIATDGCIYGRGGSERLSIVFQKKDLSLLNKIKKILKVDYPILLFKDKYVGLTINTPGIIKSFKRFNITPKKSHTLLFPYIIANDMHRHFIRGCWDGDGTVVFHYNEKKQSYRQTVRLVSGSSRFIEGIGAVLTKNKIQHYVSTEKRGGTRKPLYSISIKAESFKDFYNFLYVESKTQLVRKQLRYKTLIAYRESKYSSSGKFTFRDEKIKSKMTNEVIQNLISKKITTKEVSKKLRIHRSTVYSHVKKYKESTV